jgi:hypothetical protein
MHNGWMRASSRLVLGWTSISLVAVAIGWAALDSVIETETQEPVDVAALDPAVLSPSPPAQGPSHTPAALPRTVAPSPTKTKRVVQPANRRAPRRTPLPTPASPLPRPSSSPSPEPGEPGGEGRGPSPPSNQSPDEVVRTVKTEGGTATVAYFGSQVYLVDYTTAPGFVAQGERMDAESITVRFIGILHSSTVHAYVDGEGTFRVKVYEEGG